jgi:hypothetical protein
MSRAQILQNRLRRSTVVGPEGTVSWEILHMAAKRYREQRCRSREHSIVEVQWNSGIIELAARKLPFLTFPSGST